MSMDKDAAKGDAGPSSPRFPDIIGEWKFLEDVELWKQKYPSPFPPKEM